MKNLIIACLSFFFIILVSCNSISPKDITIIDGVKLGTSEDELYSQCDSLKVKQKIFYTKITFSNVEEIEESKIRHYVTDLFNSSQYGAGYTQHYGLYYPIILQGTKNVYGMHVLLAHTSTARTLTSTEGFNNLNNEILGISQDISDSQIDEIANMLSKKYGKPTDTIKDIFSNFFVIEGNKIKDYQSGDKTNIGEKIIWKTKYLDIFFFKGISSSTGIFNSKDHSYMMYFDGKPFKKINYNNGERPCYSFSYISYTLNNEAIKELGLDKAKL